MESTRRHIVCMPFPAQGHINPMLSLAKVLHSKDFFITFVNTEFNHRRFLKSGGASALDGLPEFRFTTIPDGLPPSDTDRNQDPLLLSASVQRTCSVPFTQLLTALNDPSSGVPPVSCVISDCFTSFTLVATAEMTIPNVFFCSCSACGFMSFFQLKELRERGLIPLTTEEDLRNGYLDTVVDWIPGTMKLRLRDMPSCLRTTDQDDFLLNFTTDEPQASLKATAIIVNTFSALEAPVINALSSFLPPVYDIGPLFLLSRQIPHPSPTAIGGLNFWREDLSCMKWLEGKEPCSVLYVNFGSVVWLTSEQLLEFAWGLANSGCEFFWVIRRDLVEGKTAVLPEAFSVETRGRSFLADWCPQEEVLAHEAIGGFLTHCGWNSTTESICAGVPMICWSFFGDQQTNCRYICSEWGIGLDITEEVRRERVERLIREVMQGQKGKEMRRKVLEWKERAEMAVKPEGSSWRNLERFIEETMKK